MKRLRRAHADLAVAAVVFVVAVVTSPHAGPAVLPAAAACGALVLRRRFPFTALLASAASAEVCLVLHGSTLVLAAPLIALYTVAEAYSRRRALTIGILATLAFAGLHILAKPQSLLGGDNLALAALGGLAVAAGDAARSRREYLAEVESRAIQAEHDREAQALRRVTDERLRIARDLHDVVGHHLALINVQASVAAHVLSAEPAQARTALGHVRQASKTALGELRDTIGLLRTPGDHPLPTEPVAGLSGLDDLLAGFRRSGLDIGCRVDQDAGRVPVPVDLTAYRVVQEALTNVCKHAPGARATVAVHRSAEALRVVVDNTRPDNPPGTDLRRATGGHGLVGMRERVGALGGALSAGPRPDGGYRVTATLPLHGTAGLLPGPARQPGPDRDAT